MNGRVRLGGYLLLWPWLALLAALPGTTPAAAPGDVNPAAMLGRALDQYAQAQAASERGERISAFQRAAAAFEAAARAGADNAEVYANAGTAALQAGDLGLAVLHFRRALTTAPRQPRALSNLHAARELLPRWVPKPGDDPAQDSAFFWHRSLSDPERVAAMAVSALLAALGFAIALARRMALAAWCAALPAVAWLALATSLVVELNDPTRPAVVLTETVARAADSHNAPARFAEPLPPGTEVEVSEQRDGWIRVRLANGRDAWVRASALRMVTEQAAAAPG